jgi:hypothetical protein
VAADFAARMAIVAVAVTKAVVATELPFVAR